MKKSTILILTFCAVLTLSFSFVSHTDDEKVQHSQDVIETPHSDAPVGGFALGDQLEK